MYYKFELGTGEQGSEENMVCGIPDSALVTVTKRGGIQLPQGKYLKLSPADLKVGDCFCLCDDPNNEQPIAFII